VAIRIDSQDGEFHLKIVDSRDAWRANWIKSQRP
jgi:hypothetical protein